MMNHHEGRGLRLAPVIELIEACLEMGEQLDPDTALAVLESYPPAVDHPLTYRPSPNLCDTCVHQRICPVLELLAQIKTHPLMIRECEAYLVGEVD